MATERTGRTPVATERTGRTPSTKWVDYFRYSDQVDIQTLFDPDGNRMTFISSSGFEEIDFWTQREARPSI
jgi:hypothetical protein